MNIITDKLQYISKKKLASSNELAHYFNKRIDNLSYFRIFESNLINEVKDRSFYVAVKIEINGNTKLRLVLESGDAWLTPWGSQIDKINQRDFLPWAGLVEEDLIPALGGDFVVEFSDWDLIGELELAQFDEELWLEFLFKADMPRRESRVWLGCAVNQLNWVRQTVPCLRQTMISPFVPGLPVSWSLELGASKISYQDLVRLECDDLLRVVNWHGIEGQLAGCLYTHGVNSARLMGWCKINGSSVIVNSVLNMESQQPHHALNGDGLEGNDRFDSLSQLEIRLSFELDEKIATSLGDIKDIAPGYIFELTQPVETSRIRIRANGQLIGLGQLVSVGDLLAVKVNEFLAGDAIVR